YAGFIVDRSRPLRIYWGALSASFVSGLVMLGAQLFALDLPSRSQVIALFASSFLTGLARAFSQPSLYAAIPRIVPRERLQQASAWTGPAMQIARISGPAIGGLVFGWMGALAAAVLVSLSLLVSMVCLASIEASPGPSPTRDQHASVTSELLSGIRFVFGH